MQGSITGALLIAHTSMQGSITMVTRFAWSHACRAALRGLSTSRPGTSPPSLSTVLRVSQSLPTLLKPVAHMCKCKHNTHIRLQKPTNQPTNPACICRCFHHWLCCPAVQGAVCRGVVHGPATTAQRARDGKHFRWVGGHRVCVCVCMHACLCVYVCAACVCTHVSMVCVCACVCACVCHCVCHCGCAHACICACMPTCVCMCVCRGSGVCAGADEQRRQTVRCLLHACEGGQKDM